MHNPNTKTMVVATTIITTVAAVGTAGIAVVHLATKTNLFTARNASALIQSMITVAAPAHVVRPHGSAMETAMTTITTADANTMGAIAVVSVVPSTNTPTVRSARAKTNRTSPKLIVEANVVSANHQQMMHKKILQASTNNTQQKRKNKYKKKKKKKSNNNNIN